jgi:hypothetical protein
MILGFLEHLLVLVDPAVKLLVLLWHLLVLEPQLEKILDFL